MDISRESRPPESEFSHAATHRICLAGLDGVREWEEEVGRLSAEERAAGEALLDELLAAAAREASSHD